MKKIQKKWLLIIATVILSFGILFFLLRGPYLSNSIKRVILPVFEEAIGERVIIDKAVINLFPFYLQTKGFKVFDKEGNRLLWITKTRAYMDFSGLFLKEIRIRRLTLKEPNLTVDKQGLDRIINHIEDYLSEKKAKNITLTLRTASITDGKFALSFPETHTSITSDKVNSEIIVKDAVVAGLSLNGLRLKLHNLPEIKGDLEGTIKTDGKSFKFLRVKVYSEGSNIVTKGEINPFAKDRVEFGSFSGKANILVSTMRKFFNLKKERNGELSLTGTVDLINPQQISHDGDLRARLNLKAKGWFYLETLMELLKVKGNISGHISIDGEIQGTYPNLFGEGKVTLKKGMLDTLPVDDVSGIIKYENKRFGLENFIAHTYSGELKGKAYLFIPHGDYSVIADVVNINSSEFLKFINWEPPFPKGKINGNFELNKMYDKDFDVKAEISYINTSKKGEELNDRLNSIKGEINLKEGILTINESQLSTSQSTLLLNGDINLKEKKLSLDLDMQSQDVLDLTRPYYNGIRAPVRFTGRAAGSSLDPQIAGNIDIGPGSINSVPFTSASGDLNYGIKSLSVGLLRVKQGESQYDASGSIKFRKADRLFSFDNPYYDASAVIKNGDVKSIVTAVYPSPTKPPITGYIDGRLSFKGDAKEFSGNGEITLKDGMVYGQNIERAIIKADLSPQKIDFPSIEVFNGESGLQGKGYLYFDERFNVLISSSNIKLKDITTFKDSPFDARFGADIKGIGTLKKPVVKFSLNVLESNLKGAKIGKGTISGELKEKRFSLNGELIDGLVTLNAAGAITHPVSWNMNVNLKKGNYDFLLSGFLKDVPKDLSVSLEGITRMQGNGENISMDSRFGFMSLNLYGQSLKNNGDIVFGLIDKEFKINSFSLVGKDTDISLSGGMKIGQNYNLAIRGNLDISPLKAMSKAIEYIEGHGYFVMGISGRWKKPEFIGKINIRDSNVMLTGFPYKIRSINGDISLIKDKLILDSLTAYFASGKVTVSGIGYTKGFTINRLSLTSNLHGIKIRHIEGIDVALDGMLFYDFSQKGGNLTGDVYIKKAKYEKRIEWKSGLLAIKETKKVEIKQPSLLGDTKLNVRIMGYENIFIDNNIAKTPLKIDLTLSGIIAQYGLLGRVETKEGSIFFRGNEFNIINASVDFTEPNRVNPFFHIQAKTFTKGYRVRLDLDGPVDRFGLSLSSDPPLSDTDIFTLLTAGQISRGTRGLESGIGAGEATAFLTGKLQDVMEERFKYITGFERIEIDPQTTAGGAITPKITVGKRLLGEKVFVTYSTSIGTTEEHIIKLEYILSKNTSLIGSRDEIGSVGADIKFRFEFK
ncbi:MAG: translocation/assembly module TamB domain-containing protein [Nitrospirae bacterium]|nr:translocation/assembly module TamB domain-containing protein [Nitrospirota bacterium]